MDNVDHIAIQVKNISDAAKWYVGKFDCNLAYIDESWALIEFHNTRLALVLPEQHPSHISIKCNDAERFGALTTHRDGTESVYIADPWLNSIEILKDK
ncbi:MAG: VOC family protein [Rhodospirillales bacterium]|nr:VOC family protein [Rhodospirillaceae bacterium]